MKPNPADGRIDVRLFLIGLSVAVLTLITLDDEFAAGTLGLSAFLLLSAVYAIISRAFSLPRTKFDDFLAGAVALLPW